MPTRNYDIREECCDKCGLPTFKTVNYHYVDHDDCLLEGVGPFLVELYRELQSVKKSIEKISSHIGAERKDYDDY